MRRALRTQSSASAGPGRQHPDLAHRTTAGAGATHDHRPADPLGPGLRARRPSLRGRHARGDGADRHLPPGRGHARPQVAGLELPHRARVAARGQPVRHRRAALGHHPDRTLRAGRGSARRPGRRAVHQRVRPTLAEEAADHPGRPDGRGTGGHLRDLGPLLPPGAPADGLAVALRPPRRPAAVHDRQGAGLALVVHLLGLHRGHRRRRRRPAHHDLGDARGVLPGPDRRARGRHRTGCDPVGDDPGRRPAVRPGGHHRRHHARPGAGARRDDRGLRADLADVRVHDPPLRERHQRDRLAHRVPLLRVERRRPGRAARRRAGALRVHPGHQHARRHHREPVAQRRVDGDLR